MINVRCAKRLISRRVGDAVHFVHRRAQSHRERRKTRHDPRRQRAVTTASTRKYRKADSYRSINDETAAWLAVHRKRKRSKKNVRVFQLARLPSPIRCPYHGLKQCLNEQDLTTQGKEKEKKRNNRFPYLLTIDLLFFFVLISSYSSFAHVGLFAGAFNHAW